VRSAFNDQIVAGRNERKRIVIVLNVFQDPFESFNHFKKRVPSKSKSKFREIDFGIFMEQFKDVWTSLVSPHEIFAIFS
jgi:hypothetical protein